jgi:hypothetical protein
MEMKACDMEIAVERRTRSNTMRMCSVWQALQKLLPVQHLEM